MNNIENESTFFVSIERKKINQDSNILIKTSKYFVKSIKVPKGTNPTNNISNLMKEKCNNVTLNSLFKTKKLLNNIPNLKAHNNIFINKSQKKKENKKNEGALIFPAKKKIDDDLDLNIEDTDEYNDNKFHININKPKLPSHNLSYFESKSDKQDNPNANSQILKSKKYHEKYAKTKSKSCSFENKDLVKWKLNQKITTLNTKIEMLNNLLKRRYKDILELQIFFEKNNSHRKIKKYILQSDLTGADLKKQIFKLKMEKLKFEENYISKKNCDEEINKEKLLFYDLKAKLIEKILDYKIKIMENRGNNELVTFNDEATIVNDSNIFDNYLNTLEDKFEKTNNLIEIKNIEPKNISLNNVTDEEDSMKLNFKEINCFKNKNTNDYFNPKFLVKTKANNRYNSKGNNAPKSNFNVFIEYRKVKK